MSVGVDSTFVSSFSKADVFSVVGKRIIENCLEGYNGTIFA